MKRDIYKFYAVILSSRIRKKSIIVYEVEEHVHFVGIHPVWGVAKLRYRGHQYPDVEKTI